MSLSNSARVFVLAILVLPCFHACGWWGKKPSADPAQPVGEARSDIPFSIKEPDVFQADIVRGDGQNEIVSHYARKNGNWRYDWSVGTARYSVIASDKVYTIRPDKKIFAITSGNGGSPTRPDPINDLTDGLLHQTGFDRFEKLEQNGNVTRYRCSADGQQDILIDHDSSLGLVIRQEIKSESGIFYFELRNVKLEADDGLFAVPTGYRKLSSEELD